MPHRSVDAMGHFAASTSRYAQTHHLHLWVGNKVIHSHHPHPQSNKAFEHQRTIRTTKTEIVFQCDVDLHVSRRVGTVVQIASGVLIEDVDGWWTLLMVQGEYGKDAF